MKEIIVIIAILGGALAHHKVHLVPAHVICPGVSGEQDILIPSPLDCAVYYRCSNGMAIPENCPPGLNWCQVLNQCTLPVLANCTIGHNPVTYGPGETIPIQTTPPPGEENVCPINGAILPNPSDCHSYFECDGEAIVSQKCPNNEAYSCWDQQCVSADKANCLDGNSQKGKNCSEEEVKLPNTKDCSSYYQCVHGQVVLKQCEEKEGFSAWYEKCIPMNETNCGQFVNSTGPPPSTTGPTVTNSANPGSIGTASNEPPTGPTVTNSPNPGSTEPPTGPTVTNSANPGSTGTASNEPPTGPTVTNSPNPGSTEPPTGPTVTNSANPGSTGTASNEPPTGPTVTNSPNPGSTEPPTGPTVTNSANPGSTGTASNEPPTGPTVTNSPNPGSTEPPTGPTVTNSANPGSTGTASNEPPTGPTVTNSPNPGSTEPPTGPTVTNSANPESTGTASNEPPTGPTVTNSPNPGSTEPPTGPTVTNSANPGSTGTASNEPPTGPTVTNSPNPGSTEPPTGPTVTNSANPESTGTASNEPPTGPTVTNSPNPGSTEPPTGPTVTNSANPGSTGTASNEPPTGPTVTNSPNPGSTEPPTGPTVTNSANPGSTGTASNEPPTGPTVTNSPNPGSTEPPTGPTVTNSANPESTGTASNEPPTGPTVTNSPNPGSTEPPTGPTVTNSANPGSTGTASNEPPTGPTVTNSANPGTTSIIETTTNSNVPITEEDVCPTDGAKIPNPVNCTSYYVCRNGTPEPEDCPNGQEYSCWDQKCKDPVDATCINQGNQQGNNCSNENESLPNLENCHSYYQCLNKTIQLKYCPIFTHYNKWFHRCYRYALAWCETNPVVLPTSTILPPIATKPPSPTDNICPNDGAKLPNIFDCTSYYVCEDNEPVPVQCPVGQAYSCWSQMCLPMKEANCISQTNPGEICSIAGLQLPNIKNCNSYYQCEHGKIKEKHCPERFEYNSWYGKCVDKKLSHCTVETSTGSPPKTESPVTPPATDSCRKNGQLMADPSDCTKYYTCENGKGVSKECPTGKNFNSWTLKCDKSDSQNDTCITDIKPGENCSVSDESIPNVWDCGSYYICVKGKVQMKFCASGTFYNKWFKMCVSFNLAFCIALNLPTMTTPPSIPPIGGPDICPVDGALIPNPVDCSTYYECINFTPQLQSCPPGLGYSCWDQKCENSTDAACILTVNSGRKCSQNHVKVQDVTDCSSYYECVDGTVKKQRCILGLQFNNRWKICVMPIASRCQTYSTVTPTPSPITVSTPNIITDVCPNNDVQLPNPTNCSTYYKCMNGSPVLHECADGLEYSCWDFKCTTPEEANCISEGSQSGMPCSYNGEKSQDPQDCHSYYECVAGIVVPKKCEWNWYYNKWFGCVPLAALAHCNKPVTITPPPIPSTTVAPSLSNDLCPTEGATLPNPASCNHYYECHNQTAVDKTCPAGLVYSCWDQKCLPKKEGKCITTGITAGDSCSREGEKLQDVDSCNTYYECMNGKVQKQYCFPLLRYNKWYKKCVLSPYDHCETYSTTQSPAEVTTAPTIHSAACAKDNSTVPNPTNCHSYYVCSHNTGTLHYCPAGYNYDCWNEKCNLAVFSRCVNAPTAYEGQSCSKEGQTIPDVTDCKKYYKCSNGIIVHLSCSFLYSYSIWAEKCVISVVAVCANSKIFGIF